MFNDIMEDELCARRLNEVAGCLRTTWTSEPLTFSISASTSVVRLLQALKFSHETTR